MAAAIGIAVALLVGIVGVGIGLLANRDRELAVLSDDGDCLPQPRSVHESGAVVHRNAAGAADPVASNYGDGVPSTHSDAIPSGHCGDHAARARRPWSSCGKSLMATGHSCTPNSQAAGSHNSAPSALASSTTASRGITP